MTELRISEPADIAELLSRNGHQDTRIDPLEMDLEAARELVATLDAAANPLKRAFEADMVAAFALLQSKAPGDYAQVKVVLKQKGVGLSDVARAIKQHNERVREITGVGYRPNLSTLPVIDFGFVTELAPLTKAAWDALVAANTGPHLFLRSGIPVRLEKDQDGRPLLCELTPDRMRHELARAACWQHKGADDFPPMDVIKDALACAEMPLPPLRRIVSVPVFAADGRLIDEPGFDKLSGIYYLPAAGFQALSLPETLTVDDVNAANSLLCEELLHDFPFASDADRDNAVALAVLGGMREMVGENTPNHAIEASIRAAGKGKLARALAGIFAGDELASTPPVETEAEWKRLLTSKLYGGAQALLIDNIERPLRSASLALAWTEPFWEDIVFHKQTVHRVPIRTIWITTANNLLMHEDLMTRSIRIRLEPKTSRPEARTDFKHADLDLWCRENRAELVRAVHILVRWWLQNGRPLPAGIQFTRHSEWCRVVGGILQAAGYKHFLGNQKEFQSNAAQGVEAASAFCSLWWDWANREAIDDDPQRRRNRAFTSELLDLARNVDGFPITDNKDGQSKALGLWLNGVRGRRIEAEEDSGDRRVWRVYQIRRHPSQVRGKQPWRIELLEEKVIGKALGEG